MTRLTTIFAAIAIVTGFAFAPASASAQMDHSRNGTTSAKDDGALTAGEIKKVDKDTGKLTIKHGDLVNLNMPGMTMTFKVQDPAMLGQVREGDQIRFRAERMNGTFTVTTLEMAN